MTALAGAPRATNVAVHSAEPALLNVATILLLASAAPEPVKIEPSAFQLKPPAASLRAVPQDCRRAAAAGEIVVCGRSPDEYRLKEVKPPEGIEIDEGGVVGFDMSGARVEPRLDQVGMPDGRISKRIMITVKVPF
ncbi:MAG TPA: hypothetical protein VFZ91_04555 [Allosphingosinicella sp.]